MYFVFFAANRADEYETFHPLGCTSSSFGDGVFMCTSRACQVLDSCFRIISEDPIFRIMDWLLMLNAIGHIRPSLPSVHSVKLVVQ